MYFGDHILTITKNKNTCSFPADDRSTVSMSLIHFLSLKDEIELHCSKDMGKNSLAQDKIDKVIYFMSDTQGVVSQSPEPWAHDKSV